MTVVSVFEVDAERSESLRVQGTNVGAENLQQSHKRNVASETWLMKSLPETLVKRRRIERMEACKLGSISSSAEAW